MKKLRGPDKWAEKRKLKTEKFLPKEDETAIKYQQLVWSLGYMKEVTEIKIRSLDPFLDECCDTPLKKLPPPDKWAEKRRLKAEKLLHKDEKTLLKYREIIRSWGYTGEVTDIKISPPDPCVSQYRDIPLLLFLHEWSFATCHAQLLSAHIRNGSPAVQKRIYYLENIGSTCD